MNTIEEEYSRRYHNVLVPLATKIEDHLRDLLKGAKRVDRIAARAKSIQRFLKKASQSTGEGVSKYDDPLSQVQDQIGARIITFYLSDVEEVKNLIEPQMRKIEERALIPDSEAEFGYVGKHFIFFIPTELFSDSFPEGDRPKFFELQIKTLFQHAWAEANHDLAYKPNCELSRDQKRMIAYTAAQAWGADRMFEDLFTSVGTSA